MSVRGYGVVKAHWLSAERLRIYPLALMALYFGWACILVLRSHGGVDASGKPLGFDFIAFWGAARMALSGHPADVYDPQRLLAVERTALPGLGEGPLGPWQYPPTFLLLVLPLGLLPYFLSYFSFIGASLAGFAVALRRTLAAQGIAPRSAWLPLLGSPAVMVNAFEGQNGFLTAALIGAALLLLQTRPAMAGLLIGLLTIKPHLGLLLPLVLLCGGCWRALLYAALGAAGFAAASIAALGSDTLWAFFDRLPVVASWVNEGKMPLAKMPTFFALGRSLGLPADAAWLLHGLMALLAAVIVGRVWLRSGSLPLRAAALLAGTMLISPYLYDYDLVWMGLALAWFGGYALRQGWRPWEKELLVLVWLQPGVMVLGEYALGFQPAPLLSLAFLLLVLRRTGDRHAAGMAAA